MAPVASPSLDDESSYDVFISYAGDDSGWVNGYLLPRLTGAGIKCLTTAGFLAGRPTVREFERAVRSSRKILLIVSPYFLAEGTAELVTILGHSYGLETRTWPVIPLYLRPVSSDRVPILLRAIEGLDATEPADWHEVTNRLCRDFERPIVPAETIPICPYPGMERFDEGQSQYFFGRRERSPRRSASYDKRMASLQSLAPRVVVSLLWCSRGSYPNSRSQESIALRRW